LVIIFTATKAMNIVIMNFYIRLSPKEKTSSHQHLIYKLLEANNINLISSWNNLRYLY